MFRISVISENCERCDRIAKNVESFVSANHMRIVVVRLYANNDSSNSNHETLLKSDLCIVDFYNFSKSLRIVASLYEKRKDLVWICVGASNQTLYSLLLLRPSGYIPDIDNMESIHNLLSRILQFMQHNEQNEYFTFKCEGDYIKIPFASISYFESSAKKVTLHLYNSTKKYYFTAKLDDIQANTPGCFLRCHQSYLVNMKCIRYFDTKNKIIIALPNEEVLISRRMYISAKQSFEAYIKGQQETYKIIPNVPK